MMTFKGLWCNDECSVNLFLAISPVLAAVCLNIQTKREDTANFQLYVARQFCHVFFSITRSQVRTIQRALRSHFCALYTYTWKENYLIISVVVPQDYFTVHIFPHFYCAINRHPVPSAETSLLLPQRLPGSRSPRGHRLQRDPQKQETRLPPSVLKHQNLFPQK